eukprot:5708238-Amphidinium_carterae.2
MQLSPLSRSSCNALQFPMTSALGNKSWLRNRGAQVAVQQPNESSHKEEIQVRNLWSVGQTQKV